MRQPKICSLNSNPYMFCHNYCGTILLVLSSGLEGHFPLHSYCRRTTAAVCSLVAGPRNAGSPTVLLDSVASRTEDFPYLVWGNVV